jgi:hypothetical protein
MIRNADGSPYQLTQFQVFDPNNTEKDLFNEIDAEIIQINGSPIYYYEVFIDDNSIDPLYREARSKVWAPKPVCLYGMYDPVSSQSYMNAFGYDSPDEVAFQLNYAEVLKQIGHPPKLGSRLFTPHKQEHWVIKHRALADWKTWLEVRLILECDRFQENLTTGEGEVTQQKVPFTLN